MRHTLRRVGQAGIAQELLKLGAATLHADAQHNHGPQLAPVHHGHVPPRVVVVVRRADLLRVDVAERADFGACVRLQRQEKLASVASVAPNGERIELLR